MNDKLSEAGGDGMNFLTNKNNHGKNDLICMIKEVKLTWRPSILLNQDRGSFFMGN